MDWQPGPQNYRVSRSHPDSLPINWDISDDDDVQKDFQGIVFYPVMIFFLHWDSSART